MGRIARLLRCVDGFWNDIDSFSPFLTHSDQMQPVFSPSVLAEMIRPDGSSTISVFGGDSLPAELAHELMSIQVCTWIVAFSSFAIDYINFCIICYICIIQFYLSVIYSYL